MDEALVVSALALEVMLLRSSGAARVVGVGVGAARARRGARRLAADPTRHVAVLGFGGALDTELEPGDVVVADALHGPDGSVVPCAHEALADALHRAGLRVVIAPIASRDHLVRGAERAELRAGGARAVDMESFWLAPLASGRVFSVARVIVDTPARELTRPLHTLTGGWRAAGALRRVGAAIAPRPEAR